MGTPDFAVRSLKALHKNNYDVVLVVTQPNRLKGRGRKIVAPPVKDAALELGYDVIQPSSIKTSESEKQIAEYKPDILVVVACGHILPKNILALPKIGAINIHASLLPKYRGPAPIQWAILNMEKETGVTSMFIDEGLDTGDILLSSKIQIASDETSATLCTRLADCGADLLIETLKQLENGDINPIAQDNDRATYAPLLKKSDGHINWDMPSENIEALIRAMTPWPGAFIFCGKKRFKIFKAKSISMDTNETPGVVIKSFPDELYVATSKGVLSILEIQGSSGKRLPIKDFLRGCKTPPKTVLS